jgi:hypothetical protein
MSRAGRAASEGLKVEGFAYSTLYSEQVFTVNGVHFTGTAEGGTVQDMNPAEPQHLSILTTEGMTNVTTAPAINPLGDLYITADGVLSALVALVVGLSALYVSLKQTRLSQHTLKYELYENRLKVYSAFAELFWEVSVQMNFIDGTDKKPYILLLKDWGFAWGRFMEVTGHVQFLFESDIQKYQEQVFYQCAEIAGHYALLAHSSNEEERRKNIKDLKKIFDWFESEKVSVKDKFDHYLNIGNLNP